MNNIIEQCSCCLENINDHDNSVTKCGHKFHTSCLNKWIQTGKNTCPLCRGILNNNTQIINCKVYLIWFLYFTCLFSLCM